MGTIKKPENEHEIDCPVCGQFKFKSVYDICEVCFWEYDPFQYEEPSFSGGANNLSLHDYIKWWNKLNEFMPDLMKRYNVVLSKLSMWTYNEMVVPRDNIKAFIEEITKYNIKINVSFYNICDQYGYNRGSFVGLPYTNEETIKKSNDKTLEIIFSNDPIKICEQYKLKQLLEILNEKEEKLITWEALTPNISIMSNPKHLPKE